MIPIYICEDNIEHLKAIQKTVENYILIQEYDMQITCISTTPKTILSHLNPSMPLSIYFLDIDLNSNIDGVELAQKIRQFDPIGYIIFITAHADKWRMTFEYKIAAFDFIPKLPAKNLAHRICECLKTAWERYSLLTPSVKKTLPLIINGRRIYHDIDNLLFFEVSKDSHRIIIYTEDSCFSCSGTLSSLEGLLPEYFFRCHRGFIANLHKVSYFDEKQNRLYFSNQIFCPVSVRQKSRLKASLNLS